EDEYDPKMEKVTTVLAIVVGVIILIVAVLLISKTIANIKISSSVSNSSSIEKSETVEMPNVIGKSYDEAKAILEKKKLVVRVKYEENDEYAEGQVISASIHDGLKVETGTEIELTVSAGSLTVPVPNVVGLALSAANKQIMDLDFKVSIEEDYSDTVEIGYVISQSPQGESKAPVNSTITIIVSKGVEAETTTVPDVVGLTEDAALEALLANDLSLASKSYVFSDIYAKGLVCRQSKDAKTNVLKGTGIELEVSMGKESEATGKYKFSGTILAPTISEDPDYASGSIVTIEIVTEDGVVLSSFTTTSFPVNPPVIKNIECPTGHILLTYEVSIGGGSTYDPETGESVVEPGEKEKRTIKRDIEFALGE
ncbi:MAG: PASTA domain-containing protein, partial [Lachnospiraceae bacterium]|nr:PASTA domain-containing protein [Lachnospiraceae bacterium]